MSPDSLLLDTWLSVGSDCHYTWAHVHIGTLSWRWHHHSLQQKIVWKNSSFQIWKKKSSVHWSEFVITWKKVFTCALLKFLCECVIFKRIFFCKNKQKFRIFLYINRKINKKLFLRKFPKIWKIACSLERICNSLKQIVVLIALYRTFKIIMRMCNIQAKIFFFNL